MTAGDGSKHACRTRGSAISCTPNKALLTRDNIPRLLEVPVFVPCDWHCTKIRASPCNGYSSMELAACGWLAQVSALVDTATTTMPVGAHQGWQ
jgi:hypothetical protein